MPGTGLAAGSCRGGWPWFPSLLNSESGFIIGAMVCLLGQKRRCLSHYSSGMEASREGFLVRRRQHTGAEHDLGGGTRLCVTTAGFVLFCFFVLGGIWLIKFQPGAGGRRWGHRGPQWPARDHLGRRRWAQVCPSRESRAGQHPAGLPPCSPERMR